jgi:hypothetical protein
MRRLVSRFIGVVAMAITMGVAAPIAQASAATVNPTSQGFNILTSPLPIKISTAPGKTVTTEIRFKNPGDQPEGVKINLLRFGASREDGQPNLFDLTPKDSYASWVHFSPSEIIAQPNVWNTVTMTINVPKEASLGYYLAVTFSPVSISSQPGAANLKGSAATLVLLNVNTGNEKPGLNIAQFTSNKGLYEYLPATFDIKLRNTGNIYIAPTGNLFLYKSGKQIAALNFNTAGGSILPNTNRTFHLDWSDGFPLYKNKIVDGKTVPDQHAVPKQDLKWDFTKANKLRIGHYTAKVLVVYDDGKQDVPLEASVNFWVLPWKVMLLLLLIVIVVGLGIFMFVRSIVRRARDRGSGQRRGRR